MKTQFDTLSLSTQALASMVGGTVVRTSSSTHKGLVTDSRIVEKGNIFLPLRGERADGHNFIGAAVANGATCVIAEQVAEETMRAMPAGCAVILVPNTLYALGSMAKWYKETINPRVIAVTGSVGNTTTKQMIHAVVSAGMPALRTEGNYNNEIGLPLTLMQLEKKHVAAVLEAGMSFRWELHRLSLICEPDVTVITNIGTSHIENLGSREGIRDAKLEMLDGMKPGGVVILNGDEPLLTAERDAITARGLTPIYIAKEANDADYLAENIRMTTADSMFDLRNVKTGDVTKDICIPVTGAHNIGNAMAAFLIGRYFGMEEADIRRGLLSFENTGMRQKIFDHDGYTVIEDCYNASPESMGAALRVLASLSDERKGRMCAVLGDMRELGSFAPVLHKRVGSFAADLGVDLLITFGKEAHAIADGAVIGGMPTERIVSFDDLENPGAAADCLRAWLKKGDTVLFKASRAVAMERVIAVLAPEAAPETH
ncbi:MAG: UDP-N-acetylmuramoyl-tripeptide--D-alanyl-D-alanine ligase [Clostridia bacterium]|nr:UDP-N-acetylmuramoyl-tripeptide--D-alanyl-D-alanine ligase [Clostridia bacterium]